jgi:hypothetical protein
MLSTFCGGLICYIRHLFLCLPPSLFLHVFIFLLITNEVIHVHKRVQVSRVLRKAIHSAQAPTVFERVEMRQVQPEHS